MSRHFVGPDGRDAFTDNPTGIVPFSGLRFMNSLSEDLRQDQNNTCYVTALFREYFLGERSLDEGAAPGNELVVYQLSNKERAEDPGSGELVDREVDGKTVEQLFMALGAREKLTRFRHVLDFALQLAVGGGKAVGTETLFFVKDKHGESRPVIVALSEKVRPQPQKWGESSSLSAAIETDMPSNRRIGLSLMLAAYSGKYYFWNQQKQRPGFRLGSYLNRL